MKTIKTDVDSKPIFKGFNLLIVYTLVITLFKRCWQPEKIPKLWGGNLEKKEGV